MKKTILTIAMLLSISILHTQDYINLGSSKEDVRKIMGDPKSVVKYETLGEEVWGYNNSSSITFKNGKINEYINNSNVLKIGDTTIAKISLISYDENRDTIENVFNIYENASNEVKDLLKMSAESSFRNEYNPNADLLMKYGYSTSFKGDISGLLASAQPFSEQIEYLFKGGFFNFCAGFIDFFVFLSRSDSSSTSIEYLERAKNYPIFLDGNNFRDIAYWLSLSKNFAYYIGKSFIFIISLSIFFYYKKRGKSKKEKLIYNEQAH